MKYRLSLSSYFKKEYTDGILIFSYELKMFLKIFYAENIFNDLESSWIGGVCIVYFNKWTISLVSSLY